MAVDIAASAQAEQVALRREILLWQRWVRYITFATLVLLLLAFSPGRSAVFLPLAVVALLYVVEVQVLAWRLHRSRARTPAAWLPTVQLAADVGTFAALCYFASTPAQFHRMLFLGFLTMQAGAFYFGRKEGVLAAGMALIAYAICALVLPGYLPGTHPTATAVSFNMALFAIVCAVQIHTFGGLRDRMDALRVYFKVIERGDTAVFPPLRAERWADDLTLLTRGFQAMHEWLAQQAGTDALTGCLNRRSLELRLRIDLRQARRRGSTVALAAIDLDNFKTINDTLGHLVGDLVLQQVASIMKTTARDTDAVARYGGDEFIIILPDSGWQGALAFADRLRRRVDDFTFGPPDNPLNLTISVGVALGSGSDPLSTDTLIQDADAALYRAKTAGRNQVLS